MRRPRLWDLSCEVSSVRCNQELARLICSFRPFALHDVSVWPLFNISKLPMTAKAATLGAPDVSTTSPATEQGNHGFLLLIVGGAAFAHLLNDTIQAMLPSIFPMLKASFALSFVYQVTAFLPDTRKQPKH